MSNIHHDPYRPKTGNYADLFFTLSEPERHARIWGMQRRGLNPAQIASSCHCNVSEVERILEAHAGAA